VNALQDIATQCSECAHLLAILKLLSGNTQMDVNALLMQNANSKTVTISFAALTVPPVLLLTLAHALLTWNAKMDFAVILLTLVSLPALLHTQA
jgi:hypothetical protein